MEISPPELAADEQKKALARSVIDALGGTKKVVRHDLLSLWSRHGELVMHVVEQATLEEKGLIKINETAQPGELEDLINLVPKDASNAQRELFFASITVAAEVYRQIQRVQLTPQTIQGPAPAPRPLTPIAAIEVGGPVHGVALPDPVPVQVPEPPAPHVRCPIRYRFRCRNFLRPT